MEPHNSRIAKIRGARFAPPMGAMPHPTLRSKITSVARVEIVLLLRFVAGNVDVNTLASKRSELIGNADILRMRRVIHNDSTYVCLRIPVAAITQKRNNASVDLWPA